MKLLLYCTKQPHKLFNTDKGFVLSDFELGDFYKDKTLLNGKIVAECDFEVENIFGSISVGCDCGYIAPDTYDYKWREDILKGACLTNDEMNEYIPNYAIHIKNLHIFDKPKELSEYHYLTLDNDFFRELKKAPQNMCYAYTTRNNKDILISIRPQWIFKILNGEKTIEVRKKVLKEMIE